MNLKRILKLLAAFITGQGVTVLTQLLVPPLFLHRYQHGIEIYGEWVALSAAVALSAPPNWRTMKTALRTKQSVFKRQFIK